MQLFIAVLATVVLIAMVGSTALISGAFALTPVLLIWGWAHPEQTPAGVERGEEPIDHGRHHGHPPVWHGPLAPVT